ncbi:MAG: FkbM family methyltransferase [Acidobacteriota bacterium]
MGPPSVPGEPAGSSFQPTRAGARQGLEYWAPNANEAQGISAYESALLARLSELVPAGAVVYDIGANIGLYAAPLSRAVGENGQVLCFEPNPVCIAYLQANLERNRCDNCRILPLAITAGEDRVPFTINFANTLLGLSHNSAFYGSKVGQEVLVPGSTLDRLTVDMELPDPTVMKIDVEGAEHALLPGMEAVLERARPLLLFEIHGEAVAAVVLPFLDRFGYRYEDADLGSHFADAPALLESFAKGVRQIICHPPTDA